MTTRERIQEGGWDQHYAVEAFARVIEQEQAKAAQAQAELVEALERDAARLAYIQQKLRDNTLLTGTQRASFANNVWHMECEVRAILARLSGEGQ